MTDASMQMIRDPNLAKNRIFVGNLPTCTREELESICHPYGKVLGSMVQKNFGFVQFETEEIANEVASSLTKSTFKGNVITVRNAGVKPPASKRTAAGTPAAGAAAATNAADANPDYNDCEIIVVDRRNTKYAEFVEERLKEINLRVDVLFPNEDVPLGKVLSNISSRGCLYAVLVTNQHEEHNSITVNILYGQPAEHRNMPVDDAIKLIADDFANKKARDAAQRTNNTLNAAIAAMSNLPKQVLKPTPGKNRFSHPDTIQVMLNLLADNMPLTVLQYDKVIKYLKEQRENQVKIELGETSESMVRDPEIELQKKILDILNKPSVAETHYKLLYPTTQALQDDFHVMELLKDERVQKALDVLMENTALENTIIEYMKF